jgi:hypothetical protein
MSTTACNYLPTFPMLLQTSKLLSTETRWILQETLKMHNAYLQNHVGFCNKHWKLVFSASIVIVGDNDDDGRIRNPV